MNEIRWMQPAGSAPPDYWNAYRNGELVLSGLFPDPVGGTYSAGLPPWPDAATYEVTAVNAAGESAKSNAIQLPEVPTGLGLVALLAILWLRCRAAG